MLTLWGRAHASSRESRNPGGTGLELRFAGTRKFRVSLPSDFATILIVQGYRILAYFLPILRTNNRQRRTSQGKDRQLPNRWQKGG